MYPRFEWRMIKSFKKIKWFLYENCLYFRDTSAVVDPVDVKAKHVKNLNQTILRN